MTKEEYFERLADRVLEFLEENNIRGFVNRSNHALIGWTELCSKVAGMS